MPTIPHRIRAQTVFAVHHAVYEAEMKRVTNNFDPHLDAKILDGILNDNYATVFRVLADDVDAPTQDDLFRAVVSDMIETRTERGMPRVAEWRALATEYAIRSAERRYDQILEDYFKQLETEAEGRRRGQ